MSTTARKPAVLIIRRGGVFLGATKITEFPGSRNHPSKSGSLTECKNRWTDMTGHNMFSFACMQKHKVNQLCLPLRRGILGKIKLLF